MSYIATHVQDKGQERLLYYIYVSLRIRFHKNYSISFCLTFYSRDYIEYIDALVSREGCIIT